MSYRFTPLWRASIGYLRGLMALSVDHLTYWMSREGPAASDALASATSSHLRVDVARALLFVE